MAFYADTFVFDNVDCSTYDLILLDVHQSTENSSHFASGPTISEDYVNRQWKPYFYGVSRPEKLTFQMSVGLNACRMGAGTHLTRTEIANIMKWLTSPNTYREMYIEQPDMVVQVSPSETRPLYHYKCMITDVELQFIDDKPWGFTFTVTCDSPYAYVSGSYTTTMGVNTSISITNTNTSVLEQLTYPKFTISYTNVTPGSLTIANSTTGQTCTLTNIPSDVTQIIIDGGNRVIRSTPQRNLYAGFNFVFVGLARGENSLTVSNTSTATPGTTRPQISFGIDYERPVDIGA